MGSSIIPSKITSTQCFSSFNNSFEKNLLKKRPLPKSSTTTTNIDKEENNSKKSCYFRITSHFQMVKPINVDAFTDPVFDASQKRREKLDEILNLLNNV